MNREPARLRRLAGATLADPTLALGDEGVIEVGPSIPKAEPGATSCSRPLDPVEGLGQRLDHDRFRRRHRCRRGSSWCRSPSAQGGERRGGRIRRGQATAHRPARPVDECPGHGVLLDESRRRPVAIGVEYLAQPHAYRADPQSADRRAADAGAGAGAAAR